MDNSISVTSWLAMFLELFSSVIPILNSPSSPCTPGCRRCRRCVSSLLAELAEHALLRIIAVHPRIFLLPLLLVAEPGFVEFPLLRFRTHWSTYWCFGIGGSQGITSWRSWDYIFVVFRISTRPSTHSLSGKKSSWSPFQFCVGLNFSGSYLVAKCY